MRMAEADTQHLPLAFHMKVHVCIFAHSYAWILTNTNNKEQGYLSYLDNATSILTIARVIILITFIFILHTCGGQRTMLNYFQVVSSFPSTM